MKFIDNLVIKLIKNQSNSSILVRGIKSKFLLQSR